MKTKDFLKKHDACSAGAKWALSISEDMADVWEAMIEQGKRDWLFWTATKPEVFPYAVLRKLACRFVRETPLADGRKVWDLLTDERSRIAIEVADLYADGKATEQELKTAYDDAYDAYAAAYAAADDAYDASDADRAAYDAARTAVRAADYGAYGAYGAYAAAYAADGAADAAAYAASDVAADDAADAAFVAALVAAKAAQIKLIAELGNPFK